MNIILKQKDIEKALQQYLLSQGVVLRNKQMDVDFTSGRGDRGLSASITIEDVDIPGFTNVFPLIDTTSLNTTIPQIKATVDGTVEAVATEAAPEAVQPVPDTTDTTTRDAAVVEVAPEAIIPVVGDEVEVATTAPASVAAIEEVASEVVAEEAPATAEEAPAPKTTTSLFG